MKLNNSIIPLFLLGVNAVAIPSTTDIADFSTENNLQRREVKKSLFFEHPNGANVVLDVTWLNKRQFGIQYKLKDTKGDSHPVYVETIVNDKQERGGTVYRCNNNNGNGNSIVCPNKVFEVSGSNTVIGVGVRLCINIQLGGDDCKSSKSLINPFK